MKIILILTLITGITVLECSAQQTAQYSQYMFNQLYINPAYAGYKEQWVIDAFYRSQWNDMEGAPRSFSMAVDGTVENDKVGLGFLAASDKLGPEKHLMSYLNYAYRLILDDDTDSRLAFGLGAGVQQLGVDRGRLEMNDPDPAMMEAATTTLLPDARAGIFYSDQHFFGGFSVDNLLTHLNKNAKRKAFPVPYPHFYFTAGALFPLNEDWYIRPSFLFKDDAKGPTNLDVNAFFIYREKFWVGASYRTGVKLYEKEGVRSDVRNGNAASFLVQFFPLESLRVGYGYDLRTGPLKGYTGDTHEFSLAYYFPRDHRVKTRNLNCPKLF